MKLSVPTNWDFELLERLKEYPVDDVYGALGKTVVGGGRPSWILQVASKRQVENYVEKVHSLGKTFTYLLNAPCLGNMEYDRKTHRELIKHLKWINEIGVDYVTVSIPYLLEIIKEQFPRLKVNVSVIAHVNSVQRAMFFEKIGADEITVDFMSNRDFKLLEKIKGAIKCDIQLLLNDICLYQCPFRYYHYNMIGHSSQTGDLLRGFYLDYCLVRCSIIRFTDPKEILKSRWIRPEDLKEYEKIGIDSFKISGRSKLTEWILNVVKSYSAEKYDGNLIDLIDCVESPKSKDEPLPYQRTLSKYMETLLPRIPSHLVKFLIFVVSRLPLKQRAFFDFAAKSPPGAYKSLFDWYFSSRKMSQNVYIANDKLDGFINFFKEKNCLLSCSECNYCEEWAKKVIKINQKEVDEYVTILTKLSHDLSSSRFLV